MHPRPWRSNGCRRAMSRLWRGQTGLTGVKLAGNWRCGGRVTQLYAARQVTPIAGRFSVVMWSCSRSKSKSMILAGVFFSGVYRAPATSIREGMGPRVPLTPAGDLIIAIYGL